MDGGDPGGHASLLPTALNSDNADPHGGRGDGLGRGTTTSDLSASLSSVPSKDVDAADVNGASTRSKWWRTTREFWEALAIAYDTVGSMVVGVAWCYIVPLAALPDDGCPGSDGCWTYISFIFLYILFCTALIPLIIAQTVRHFSREVTRLTNEHRSDGSKSTIRLTFFKRSQNLLVMAYSVTWSVANSTFLYYAIAQLQYQLDNDDDGSDSGDDDQIRPSVDDTNPFQTDDRPPSAPEPGMGQGQTLVGNAHRFLKWATDHHQGDGDGYGYGDGYGGGGGSGDNGGGGGGGQQHGTPPWDNSGPISDGSTDAGSSEARFRMLGYSLVFAVGYTALAVGFIYGASDWLGRYGCCSRSAYFIELSFLLQNNWYYVVGYGWHLFFSYLWFASLQYSDGSAFLLLLLDLMRAVLFSAIFGWLAVYKVPYKVADREEAKGATAMRAKMRVLLFMTCVVIVVCAQSAVPAYFVNTYLAEVTKMSAGAQTALLYAFMAFGVWGLTVFNLWAQRLPPEEKDDVKLDFTLEMLSWTVSFLGWTPGKATVIVLSESVSDWLGSQYYVLIPTQCLLGMLITLVVAIGSTLLHQAGEGVVVDRTRAMTLRTLKRFSDSMSSVRHVCRVLLSLRFQFNPRLISLHTTLTLRFSESMSSLSASDSGYPASNSGVNSGSDMSGVSGAEYHKLAASDRESEDERTGMGHDHGHDGGRWTNASGQTSDRTSDMTPNSSRATVEF